MSISTSLNDPSDAPPEGARCMVKAAPEQAEKRGLVWVVAAFLICPCHLPLTLWLAATLLSGTTAAVLLDDHPYVAGAVITTAWLAATWRGIRLIQSARKHANGMMRTSTEAYRP